MDETISKGSVMARPYIYTGGIKNPVIIKLDWEGQDRIPDAMIKMANPVNECMVYLPDHKQVPLNTVVNWAIEKKVYLMDDPRSIKHCFFIDEDGHPNTFQSSAKDASTALLDLWYKKAGKFPSGPSLDDTKLKKYRTTGRCPHDGLLHLCSN